MFALALQFPYDNAMTMQPVVVFCRLVDAITCLVQRWKCSSLCIPNICYSTSDLEQCFEYNTAVDVADKILSIV